MMDCASHGAAARPSRWTTSHFDWIVVQSLGTGCEEEIALLGLGRFVKGSAGWGEEWREGGNWRTSLPGAIGEYHSQSWLFVKTRDVHVVFHVLWMSGSKELHVGVGRYVVLKVPTQRGQSHLR